MFVTYNPNPVGRFDAGDCVIRAVAKALDISWEDAYTKLCISGFAMGDLPNADNTFGAVLRMNGFKKRVLPDSCPDCYTVEEFARDNPNGVFVLGLGGHVVTVENGNVYDAWDSSKGVPVYYWYKDERMNYNGATVSESNTDPGVLGGKPNSTPAANPKPATPAANPAAK